MNDEKKPGNPAAFPRPETPGKMYQDGSTYTGSSPQSGMTLLDWFAGRATLEEVGLDGEIPVESCAKLLGVEKWDSNTDWFKLMAIRKYDYAEAMLRERERRAKS